MADMKAIRFHAYGGPEVLVMENVPLPQIGTGEVLVKVSGAGVNPLDWKVREGHTKDWLAHQLPLIPGWDVSGVVEDTASDVTDFRKGDAVYGMLDFRRNGAYADYVATESFHLALKPKTMDGVNAGAVPLAALTAWQLLFDLAELKPGQTILIHAAAGGVGHFAVQFAKWKKARVIGTASAENADFVLGLGADQVIDYKKRQFEKIVHDIDVVLDPIGGETQERSWKVLRKGGILVATLGISYPKNAGEKDLRGKGVMVRPDQGQLSQIAELIDTGHVKPAVNNIFPLEKAADAQNMSQTGHTKGKIVLQAAPG